VKTWLKYIPLRMQYVLGSPDLTIKALRSLPKCRVQTRQVYKAATPTSPLKTQWKFTEDRVIHFEFIDLPDGSIDAYAGIARGSSRKHSSYTGFTGRAGGYLRDRRRGHKFGHEPTWRERALLDPRNRPNLRIGSRFAKTFGLQKIEFLEDVLTIDNRAVQDDGTTCRWRTPEVLKLVKHL
jgi:hypothetical protein